MILLEICLDSLLFPCLIMGLALFKNKFLNYINNLDTEDWLPIEQMREFRQLFYLIMAGLLFANLYYLVNLNTYINYIWNFVLFDFIISILAGIYIFEKDKLVKSIILIITLIPFTGLTFTGYDGLSFGLFLILELIHSIGMIYVIVDCFKKFKIYSKSNKLGYTILILYIVVFISVFLSTQFEGLGLLDSLVYCSNAFTSNGYGLVNATNFTGKIISLILVWSGYILSGVSTALLTLAVLSRYYNKRLDDLDKKYQESEDKLDLINKKLDKLLDDE